MKIYRVERIGRLMVTRAYIRGPSSSAYPRLLIDTGSTYTIIRTNILEDIGYAPASVNQSRQVVTASKVERLPVVKVEQFNCLGILVEGLNILAHTLPKRMPFDGILGMDFIEQHPIELRPYHREVIFRE